MEKKAYIKIFTSAIFAFAFLAITPQLVYAATLYFSPLSGSRGVGTTFQTSVYVSSADQAMNAASGVISFPRDTLEVTSLSKTGSIFSLWVQEPLFSNSAGTVNFEGIVLNPGFTGSSGKAITITFRTKAAGNAPLTFSSGSVLANDGKGTNILTRLGAANFSIGVAEPGPPETITPSEVAGTLAAPEINSPTHPDPKEWYAFKDAAFSWKLPSGATGARLLVGRIPNAVPTVTYTPAISSRELDNLEDGVWYFSAQLQNSAGWGAISRFRFQIDTEKPQLFETRIDNGGDPTNPAPILHFKAVDYISGIEYYEVKIGEKEDIIPVEVEKTVVSNPYTMPRQSPGKHTVVIKAVDAAHNETLSALDVIIEPLRTPVITEYSKELQSGEPLIVHGSTYAKSRVNIWLQKEKDDPKSFTVESDQDGNFTFIADERLNDGIYKIWAEVVDARGARSELTEKITVAVAQSAIFRFGTWAVNLLAVVVPLAALIIALLFILWYGWHKFSLMRIRLRKEVREAEHALHGAFALLKEDMREQIKMLEKTRNKRQLTEEEEKIIKQLRKDLDDAEKFVKKEIKDIEKEIK